MKKVLLSSVLFLAMTGGAFAHPHQRPCVPESEEECGCSAICGMVVPISEMDEELMTNFLEGSLPCVFLEVPEGTVLPLRLSLTGEFFDLEMEEGTPSLEIRVKKLVYMRVQKHDIQLSLDCKHWDRPGHFFTGSANLSLKNSEEERLGCHFGLELNKKPPVRPLPPEPPFSICGE